MGLCKFCVLFVHGASNLQIYPRLSLHFVGLCWFCRIVLWKTQVRIVAI